MKLIKDKINLKDLTEIANERFGDMIKAVVDIDLEIMVIGGDLHADEEAMLLYAPSNQENLWGINIYVEKPITERIEFDSVINIRPRQNNRSRDVVDLIIRKQIIEIVNKLIE